MPPGNAGARLDVRDALLKSTPEPARFQEIKIFAGRFSTSVARQDFHQLFRFASRLADSTVCRSRDAAISILQPMPSPRVELSPDGAGFGGFNVPTRILPSWNMRFGN
jgi:hypothetical protein